MSSLRPTARVARGATYVFIQGFTSSVISVLYFAVLARSLPQEEMGVFALLSFILSLAQVFGTFALPSAAAKYIPQYLAEDKIDKARSVTVRILQIYFFSSIITFVLLFIPAEWLSIQLFNKPDYAFFLRLIALSSIFNIIYFAVIGFLQGLQRIRDMAAISLLYTIIQNVVGMFLLSIGWGLYAVVLGWLAGLAVASVSGLTITAKYLGISGKAHPIRPLFKFSFPLYVASCISYFVGWADQLILVFYMGLFHGAIEAQRLLGIYYLAVRASTVPALFSTAVTTALFPQLSTVYAQRGSTSLEEAFKVSSRYSVLVGFPLIVGVATLAYPIIILFGGVEYAGAAVPLVIISIGTLVSTLGIAIGSILMTLERTLLVSLLAVISVVTSVLISVFALAILDLGIMGAAWARTFASIITLSLSLYALSHHIKISFDKEALWKACVASAFMVLAIFAMDILRGFVSPISYQFLSFRLLLLPVYITVGALTYFISLVGLKTIKKHDVTLVSEYLPKSFKWITRWLERLTKVD